MSEDAPFLVVGGRGGRPPRAGVKATNRVYFRLTNDEKKELQKIARFERRPLAQIVRDAIDSYVGDFSERVVFTPSGDRFKSSVRQ